MGVLLVVLGKDVYVLKRLIIIISSVALFLIIFLCILFDPMRLFLMPNNEEITLLSVQGGQAVAAVSEIGNVYIKGSLSQRFNYGTDLVRQLYNLISDSFVRIYDKNDAVSVNLSNTGGCIVTEQSDVYVFVNDSVKNKTPTYLCSGYIKAYLAGDDVYLLRSDGTFGAVNLENPTEITVLGRDVVDFDIEYSDSESFPYGICFALTKDHRLFVMKIGETLDSTGNYIDDVVEFDVVSFVAQWCMDDHAKKHVEISLLNSKGQAFWYDGDLDENYSKIADMKNYVLAGSNVSCLVSYPVGVAMLNNTGQVSLYGYDFGNEDYMSGDILFDDVKGLFSSGRSLMMLYQNGEIDYFGFDAGKGSTRYIKQPYWH